jgi:hypothetical protein
MSKKVGQTRAQQLEAGKLMIFFYFLGNYILKIEAIFKEKSQKFNKYEAKQRKRKGFKN